MNIFVTSDLHCDHLKTVGLLRQVNRFLQERASREDVLLLLGDYGNTTGAIRTAVHTVCRDFPGRILATIGNHDCWVEPGVEDSFAKRELVAKAIESAGGQVLDTAAHGIVVNDIGFAGTMGWYDYSFGDARGATYAQYVTKRLGNAIWADGRYCRWNLTDKELVSREVHHLETQLKSLQQSDRCKRIVIGMHHVPIKALLFHPRWMVPHQHRFMNAYLGSDEFHRLITNYDGVSHVFCGHIHSNKQVKRWGVHWQSIGSGYDHKEVLMAGPDGTVTSHMFS